MKIKKCNPGKYHYIIMRQFFIIALMLIISCTSNKQVEENFTSGNIQVPFIWENATVYFILTDRFNNGDPANDTPLGRKQDGGPLRSFMGGDIKGVTQKIEEGYFDDLGVNAFWITPPIEQIHGFTDEGWGKTYGYHGYWARDWTNIDPNYGTINDLKEMVDEAHEHGIRVLLDVVLNHTGPVTPIDSQWPDDWVRTSPTCTHQSYETSVPCTLVENLPDIKTDSKTEVELPDFLMRKWEQEDRLEQERQELEMFFKRTGYARLPKYYIIKWLTDYVRELGIDGFRVDTAKHLEAYIWEELYHEAMIALEEWRKNNPDKKLDDRDFYMVGEVYGYGIQGGLYYNYGDSTVNFFNHKLKALINFSFKSDATRDPEDIFSEYSELLNGPLSEYSVMNYISSHDDSGPFDLNREKPLESGTKLLLTPGAVQIYYGDELARPLIVEGTKGDAHLRSFMNWEELDNNTERNGHAIREILGHWQKLGVFRREHPAVGAGQHEMISKKPYIFTRVLNKWGIKDQVIVAMDSLANPLNVKNLFADGTVVKDYYSDKIYTVKNGIIEISGDQNLYLIGVPY
jgi:alpha-amylase